MEEVFPQVLGICDHRELIWEVHKDAKSDVDCIICCAEERREINARTAYGPGFNVIRFRFDRHKQALEKLIMASSADEIPAKYLYLMRQLASRKPVKTELHSKPIGIGGASRSSLTLVLPPIYDNGLSSMRNLLPQGLPELDEAPPSDGYV